MYSRCSTDHLLLTETCWCMCMCKRSRWYRAATQLPALHVCKPSAHTGSTAPLAGFNQFPPKGTHRRGTLPSGVKGAPGQGRSSPYKAQEISRWQQGSKFRKHVPMMPDPSATSSAVRIRSYRRYHLTVKHIITANSSEGRGCNGSSDPANWFPCSPRRCSPVRAIPAQHQK